MVLRPARTESFSWESWDLPPVASHRYCGMSPEQMIAVFSDSTRAMGLSGCCGRRCSPKRHWVSCQDSSRVPVFLRMLWTQLILNLASGSLTLLPVAGLYFMIFPVRQLPLMSTWK